MKNIFIICMFTLLFSIMLLARSDENILNYKVSVNQKDTIKIETIKPLQPGFLSRNEGTLIGSLLAGMIALFSVLFTNYKTRQTDRKKEIERYYGLLFAIDKELDYHKKVFPHLKSEINNLSIISEQMKILLIDKLSRDIPISFMKEIRSNILSIEGYNTVIFQNLLDYITNCEMLNEDIKFEKLSKVKNIISEDEYIDASKDYFSALISGIDKIDVLIDPLKKLIVTDIQALGLRKRLNKK
jgi:hypothetical protein